MVYCFDVDIGLDVGSSFVESLGSNRVLVITISAQVSSIDVSSHIRAVVVLANECSVLTANFNNVAFIIP